MGLRLKRKNGKRDEENLIPLINIVFLILIFFLSAGVLRSFEKKDIKPAEANFSYNGERPSGPVLIGADGQISVGGIAQDPASLMNILKSRVAAGVTNPLPVVADKTLPARQLVAVIETAKMAGIKKIRLVTRRRAAP